VARYFVKVELQVETDEPRLITVEVQGRLLDGTGRPPGLRIEDASVVAIHEIHGQPLPDEA
jgi:hypothetical protein